MSNLHHIGDVAKGGKEVIDRLAPLPERKDPGAAFMLGLFFGALGVALYFRSAKDFFVCMGLFILASILLPGVGLLLGWFLSPCYGAYRAHSSNQKLGL